jgi:hypothetical protein
MKALDVDEHFLGCPRGAVQRLAIVKRSVWAGDCPALSVAVVTAS